VKTLLSAGSTRLFPYAGPTHMSSVTPVPLSPCRDAPILAALLVQVAQQTIFGSGLIRTWCRSTSV